MPDARTHIRQPQKKRAASARARTQPLKQPRQDRSIATVQALLDATVDLLSRQGYAAATTNRIAERAGVSVASLYQYFPNKQSLVAAIIDRQIDRMLRLMGTLLSEVAGAPFSQAIPRVIHGVFEAYAKDERLHRELLRNVPQLERLNPAVQARRAITAQLGAWLSARDDLDLADPMAAARVVVNAGYGALEGAILLEPGAVGDPAYVDGVVRLFTRFVAAVQLRRT